MISQLIKNSGRACACFAVLALPAFSTEAQKVDFEVSYDEKTKKTRYSEYVLDEGKRIRHGLDLEIRIYQSGQKQMVDIGKAIYEKGEVISMSNRSDLLSSAEDEAAKPKTRGNVVLSSHPPFRALIGRSLDQDSLIKSLGELKVRYVKPVKKGEKGVYLTSGEYALKTAEGVKIYSFAIAENEAEDGERSVKEVTVVETAP